MERHRIRIIWLALLCSLAAPAVHAQAPADRWSFALTPYLWLPSMDGSLRYGPPPPGGAAPIATVDAETLLGALDAVFMGTAEARRGKWSIVTDFIYLSLSNDRGGIKSIDFNPGSGPVNLTNTSLNVNTDSKLTGRVWQLAGGYSAIYQPRHTMDIIAGVRYFDLTVSTNWQLSAAVAGPAGAQNFAAAGGISQSEELWDAIVGVRGHVKIGDGNWFVPYHLDAGAGSSKFTWQGAVGLGYSYAKWGDVHLVYRYLSWEQGNNKLVDELKFGGFAAGLTFRF